MKPHYLCIAILTCALAACGTEELAGESADADNVAGVWLKIDNDCEDDETALVITQSGGSLSFSGGFDYQSGTDTFTGSITGSSLEFTDNGTNSTAVCTAQVASSTLSGTCEVSGAQSETCIFEYTSDISGTYQLVENECEDDGNPIIIAQSGTSLTLSGGFDYQSATPDSYAGSIQTGVSQPIMFTVSGSDSTASCQASMSDSLLTGVCTITGAQTETCGFSYSTP